MKSIFRDTLFDEHSLNVLTFCEVTAVLLSIARLHPLFMLPKKQALFLLAALVHRHWSIATKIWTYRHKSVPNLDYQSKRGKDWRLGFIQLIATIRKSIDSEGCGAQMQFWIVHNVVSG
ncbi:MAG: hypothetical protein ACK578_20560 [Pirellula sp.]